MKKVRYETPNQPEEYQILYFGIDELEGGWMTTTCGNPSTYHEYDEALNDYDEESDEYKELVSFIEWADGVQVAGIGDECDENDIEYVNEWLEIWGIRG